MKDFNFILNKTFFSLFSMCNVLANEVVLQFQEDTDFKAFTME